ncbi:hypothetical protein A3F65_03950 [Candidatus Saccharibacteria bacterium RIFCSPHIGHO2_12_FULL_47_16b]|nr:MAG: hypothetical protein A3F65_03950 [Candidatus Saccharibacteria bacterium RIFCSPHIGHO2_12_FULL_47_16b]OGL39403.1 MAG: hypothetical protein A3J32_00600 [Candidatus Saccharibacteria bacterium RIFCSPLOWO2_02_FULL_46_7]
MRGQNVFENAPITKGYSDRRLAWPWPDPLGDRMIEVLVRYRDIGDLPPGVLAAGEGAVKLNGAYVDFEAVKVKNESQV